MNQEFKKDYEFKIGREYNSILLFIYLFRYHDLKYLYYFRKSREKGILKNWYKYKTKKLGLKYGIEIDSDMKIGSGIKFRSCV